MTHTKGEWAWQLFGDTYMLAAQHGRREIIIGATNAPIFNYPVPAMTESGILKVVDKDHPNAKLIASAPDLLEALQTIKTFIDSNAGNPCPEPIRRLISKESEIAIKKATE